MMHLAALRARALAPIARSYLVAALPALALAVGTVTLIEIVYRRSTQPEQGALMKLFWIPMDTATPWPWLGAVALASAGYLLLRLAWPRVDAAWQRAGEEIHAHG